MDVYLVDGTYELFRHFYAVPSHVNSVGEEVGAVVGVLDSVASMLENSVTHVGVATDHVIRSFRNDLWPGYKTEEGVPPQLLAQFPLLEEALTAMGVVVWPMVELEADDALAGAAASLGRFSEVHHVLICTPDKDLAQCVVSDRVLQLDRRAQRYRDEIGVIEKYGVAPSSIPDYLALVGDTSDGYPGLEGWGEKSTSAVLSSYTHLEAIPADGTEWKIKPRRYDALAKTLRENMKLALLFRDLATLRKDEPRIKSPDELSWKGPDESFSTMCKRLDAPGLEAKVAGLRSKSIVGQVAPVT
ncbi:MAG TPA: 5'-3' exonuclease H3TH domain-containing protein [Candidatus Bathyarchaeia archaeon]|nr:5'-3' exonuclease H3TH domain-containing protein [Candidatus Bathyarchaeia archaeon]